MNKILLLAILSLMLIAPAAAPPSYQSSSPQESLGDTLYIVQKRNSETLNKLEKEVYDRTNQKKAP